MSDSFSLASSMATVSPRILSGGPVRFRPNPAPAGGEVEISYEGKSPLLYKAPGDPDWKPVPLDPKTGKGRLRVPNGVPILVFTDDQNPSISAEVAVVEPGR